MTDKFGRDVTVVTIGIKDTYTVNDGSSDVFTLTYPTGTAERVVMEAINAMAPAGYVDLPAYYVDRSGYLGSEEITETRSPVATVDLPDDGGIPARYTVGQKRLHVFLNGQHLLLGVDYEEVGNPGEESSQIRVLQPLYENDYVEIQIK